MKRFLAILILAALLPAPAGAIIMRHDRDAARYRELAAKYPAVGALGDRVACTLIAPRWALGAAHTIENFFNPGSDPFVTFGQRRYRIDKIVIHPRRVRDAVDSDWDLVLLRLAEPVEGIAPVLLYDGTDEVDQIATLVGRGAAGPALPGATRTLGVAHAARNLVEGAFEHSLVFSFSPPPAGEDLEGVPGPSDSGCPALLEKDGKLYTIGVGAWGTETHDPAKSAYGSIDAFARVSAHRTWIVDTMAADPPSSIAMYG
ncbi:MAG TPA: trypsin-like serine protease, partial [Thermoanaerobaculia bacterium]|nr:trypsin-like serine protease [Thermoanaerobaculia bacterium]